MTSPHLLSAEECRAAQSELETVRDFVRWSASRLSLAGVFLGHGTDDPVDEACYLIWPALGLEPSPSEELWDSRLTSDEKQHLCNLLCQRVNDRAPVAYLINRAWFAGLEFFVDQRVLIPRSPLAELIEQEFSPWIAATDVRRVLDVGTGSGCIAVACALVFPEAFVDAVDCSAEALDVARINIRNFGLENQVAAIESDVFANVAGPYDLIVSNPPYVDAGEIERLPAEYHHEPLIGLAAGDDGLDIVRRILADAGSLLSPNGILVVEVGASRSALMAAFPALAFVWLELARGGENIFLLQARDLRDVGSNAMEGTIYGDR